MTPFDYVTVLISIILGLGITQLVSGFADLIVHSKKIEVYLPHVLFSVLVFFLHIQEWWTLYDLRMHVWRLPLFLLVLLYPINLFILAKILFPASFDFNTSLRAFYFDNCKKLFGCLFVPSLLSAIENTTVHHLPVMSQGVQAFVMISSGWVVVKGETRGTFHYALIIAYVILTMISFAVKWNEWLIA